MFSRLRLQPAATSISPTAKEGEAGRLSHPYTKRPAKRETSSPSQVPYICLSIMLLLWFSMIVAKCPCLQRPGNRPIEIKASRTPRQGHSLRQRLSLSEIRFPGLWNFFVSPLSASRVAVDLARVVQKRETALYPDLKRGPQEPIEGPALDQ
jgi:hypothetical protein